MKEVKVKTSRDYSVFVTSGGEGLSLLLDTYKIKRIFVVTDEHVEGLYDKFLKLFDDRVCGVIAIKPGEESKSLETLIRIYSDLIASGADRKTALVAFGGGVVGDIGGYAASTFMRGMPLIQIPTTLMAQCDSSIGGKNGVNFSGIKNIVGTFYQPEFVYSDVNFLKTLDDRNYFGGLAEIIKYGFVCDANLFRYIEDNRMGIREREVDKLLHMVSESAKIKSLIVEKDEYDSGLRQVLNFGHTIGHGIEGMLGFKLNHGEAVSVGMNVEALIALKLGYINEENYLRLINVLKHYKLPTRIEDYDIEELMNLINHDKKKNANNLKFALPEKLGHAIITAEIKQNTIREAIKEAMRRTL